jgi:hypothetical protein
MKKIAFLLILTFALQFFCEASPNIGTNWCGYVAAFNFATPTKSGGRVSEVSGTWVVPSLKGNTSSCAIWIGIDGYFSTMAGENVLEQLGTRHSITNGKQTNTVYFQMYPSTPVAINNFPCDVGDMITATLTLQAGTPAFTITVINHTKSKTYTKVNVAAPTYATLSTAEWIVEDLEKRGIQFADFGTIKFTQCYAKIDALQGPINCPHWHNRVLSMKNASNQVKAIPSALVDSTSFSVSWKSN